MMQGNLLAGFTRSELEILVHHLAYAAERRQCQLDQLRNDVPGLRRRRAIAVKSPQGFLQQPPPARMAASSVVDVGSRLGGLIRERRFLEFLIQSIADGIDLSGGMPDSRPRLFLDFLENELSRARGAIRYIEATPFDRRTRRALFRVLDIEIRFFSRLLKRLEPV